MSVQILTGDCRKSMATLPDASVHCCVTSPPYYGLRDYGHDGQLGLEETPEAYVAGMVEVFREVRRVLRDDGTLWLNVGDSYSAGANNTGSHKAGSKQTTSRGTQFDYVRKPPPGLKPKDLIGVPWRVAFALQADGWWLRSDIIWHKPNPMPESVTDRPTSAHEHIFLLSKSARYWYDADAITEEATPASAARYEYEFGGARAEHLTEEEAHGPGTRTRPIGRRDFTGTRNRRNVWTVAARPFSEAHFAVYPPDLIEPCILAGCPEGGTVLDPFGGAGTTGLVADRLGRNAILCELNPEYAAIAERRIRMDAPMFADVEVLT